MMEKRILILAGLFIVITLQAASIKTHDVYSPKMDKEVQVVIVAPTENNKPAPVIYLLHGHSGNARSWIDVKPNLGEIADQYHVIFVCPDGKNSWYWDSPKDPASQYETFVSKELVSFVDAHYSTHKEKKGRAITGLSMGGHGALWLAFHHTDIFGAAGSTSGGVDICPFPKNWEMWKQLGEYETNKDLWESHTVINQVKKLQNDELKLIIDCGYDDFFFEVNNHLHMKLLEQGINHDYLVRPGGHDGNYWRNAIDYQILFFLNYFNKN